MFRNILLWSARNRIKKFIKTGCLTGKGDDRIAFKEENGKITNETVAQFANELLGNEQLKASYERAGLRNSDLANIIREELKKFSGKVVGEKKGRLDFSKVNEKINQVQDKIYDKERDVMLGRMKNRTRQLIKEKRLQYLKDGQVSYEDKDGGLFIGIEKIAVILLDKAGRTQCLQYGILEEDIVEIIKNKGQ